MAAEEARHAGARPVDALGLAHAPAGRDPRIVSLVPSLTELLFDLDLADRVVGRTGFCIHPRGRVHAIPKVGGTKDVDIERVRALAPTHLVVNIDENEKSAVDALRAYVPHVIVTHPIEVEDNLALYRLFGAVFDRAPQALALAGQLEAQLAAACARNFTPARVLYLVWRKPWMTVGPATYIARMLARVGLEAVAPSATARYPVVDFDRFDFGAVDAVLLSSEPYRFGEAHARELRADPRLARCRVLTIDGEMTSWYGSRAIAGLRYLREFRDAFDRLRAPAGAVEDGR